MLLELWGEDEGKQEEDDGGMQATRCWSHLPAAIVRDNKAAIVERVCGFDCSMEEREGNSERLEDGHTKENIQQQGGYAP